MSEHHHHHHHGEALGVALIVVSDRAADGRRPDKCEPALRAFLETRGQALARVMVVPDEIPDIQRAIRELADKERFDLILSAGGTGVAPRDVTPEATRPLIERETPGLPEAMRAASMAVTPYAMLSRGLAGFRGASLIINLPGSPKAAVENLAAVFDAVAHGVGKAKGDPTDCAPIPARKKEEPR
ncbi:MAG: MogA/MoaB family molybdenum cofactor biosynthesis protein [Nitrospinae bacterium]|nr:MogA/MoaB family molybdenum cofactor biosynthesis protein [Nitrospinota bacterium]